MTIIPVILSGGAGSRLWPASRDACPKQFLCLFGRQSSYQESLLRVADPALFAAPLVMANRDHRFLAAEQSEELGLAVQIVLEPERRDSGPAMLAAAHVVARHSPKAVLLVLPADHRVRNAAAFLALCREGAALADEGGIVTFGVAPEHPSASYGYLKPGAPHPAGRAFSLEGFVEKPDPAAASRLIAEGWLWNCGNFAVRADVLIAEYARHSPETEQAVRAAVAGGEWACGAFVLQAAAYGCAETRSFDHAVMEKTQAGLVLPGDFGWADIGGWDAVWAHSDKDESGNALRGAVLLHDARRNMVMSEGPMTTLCGVEDLAVVTTPDAVFVGRRDDPAGLKACVARVRRAHEPVVAAGSRVYRPWGSWQALDAGERYRVKRIVVKPGQRLSLQQHHHRSEHWVVVRGAARVALGDEERTVHENESIYIPTGAVHRLENPGRIDLELIEVQTGSYLGEDDITRLEDVYNRC